MKKWKIPWPGQWTKKKKIFHSSLLYSGKDFIVSAALFFVTVVLCLLLRSVDTHRDTSYVAVIFFLDVFLTALLTGLGVFDKIGQYAGAGAFVPISGFANAMVSPAMEFRREGMVLGLGAKLFTIAGPVLVWGTSASVLVGIVYALFPW